MQTRVGFSIAMLWMSFSSTSAIRGAEPVPYGSQDYEPSPERPMGWRGDGSGRFPGATPCLEWSAEKNVRWSATVGTAFSSPVVTGRFAFVTAEPNLLVCVDRADGRVKWRVETKPADLSPAAQRAAAAAYELPEDGAGMSAATPLTDGSRVYVVLANGIVKAVDFDGRAVWTAFIEAEQNTGYGRSASPILVGGRLIVHMTHLYAFDPATGKRIWVNTEAESGYGTPVAFRVGETDLIATPEGDVVRADTGKRVASELAKCHHASPSAARGVLYFGDSVVKAVRLDATFAAKDLWEEMIEGAVFGSPLWHDDTLFTVTGKGELFAFDARDGRKAGALIDARPLFGEEGQRAGAAATYSSLTLAGAHLFLTSVRGETVVLEAGRDAKLVARNKLPAGTRSTPVLSGKDLFLRDGDKLFCIGH